MQTLVMKNAVDIQKLIPTKNFLDRDLSIFELGKGGNLTFWHSTQGKLKFKLKFWHSKSREKWICSSSGHFGNLVLQD